MPFVEGNHHMLEYKEQSYIRDYSLSDRFRKFSSSDLIKSKQFLQTILPIKVLRYEACSLQTSNIDLQNLSY
jgi:hypothetical protein